MPLSYLELEQLYFQICVAYEYAIELSRVRTVVFSDLRRL